jgi:hypothetical protein
MPSGRDLSDSATKRYQEAAGKQSEESGEPGGSQAFAAAFISFLYARTLSSEAPSTMSATER